MRVPSMTFLAIAQLLLQMLSVVQGKQRVIGGADTDISLVPYQISLRLIHADLNYLDSAHICGGAVISSRIILTAGQCFYCYVDNRMRKANELLVVMGDTYLDAKSKTSLTFLIKKRFIHPSFRAAPLANDIALVCIRRSIPANSIVQALPITSHFIGTGTPCLVSGWGSIKAGGPLSNVLQSATVKVISIGACESTYGRLPEKVLCAGYLTGAVDSCRGDSGGPLVCHNLLVGIVSRGRSCGIENFPGIYTEVKAFYGWIMRTNASIDYLFMANLASTTSAINCAWLTVLAVSLPV